MKRAFTLLELLIVVVIIAILAAIAIPNLLEAQARSKSARAKSDMRTLTLPIEAYFVDNNRFPQNCRDENRHGLALLSTPIAYITDGLLHDPFIGEKAKTVPTGSGGEIEVKDRYRLAYLYSLRGIDTKGAPDAGISGTRKGQFAKWYILRSLGPDSDADGFGTQIRDAEIGAVVDSVYDATNGTISSGNLYRAAGMPPDTFAGRVFVHLISR